MRYYKLQYQVPQKEYQLGNTCRTTYKLESVYVKLISDKNGGFANAIEAENEAIEIAISNGADLNKNIRFTVVTELEMIIESFHEVKKEIPNMRWGGANNRDGQTVYGDVIDWVRDNYPLIRASEYEELFINLCIGEYALRKKWKG